MLCNTAILIIAAMYLFNFGKARSMKPGMSKMISEIQFRNGSQATTNDSHLESGDTIPEKKLDPQEIAEEEQTRGKSLWERWTTMDVDDDMLRDVHSQPESGRSNNPDTTSPEIIKATALSLHEQGKAGTT
jgi:hypothetical protein